LSHKFKLPIQQYGLKEKKDMVKDIFHQMREGQICGKLMVIAWKHENLPKLARQLGCGPDEGCPFKYKAEEFDQVWNIHYIFDQPVFSSKKSGEIGGPAWTVTAETQNEGFDLIREQKKIGAQAAIAESAAAAAVAKELEGVVHENP
jgi:hypothetical protein